MVLICINHFPNLFSVLRVESLCRLCNTKDKGKRGLLPVVFFSLVNRIPFAAHWHYLVNGGVENYSARHCSDLRCNVIFFKHPLSVLIFCYNLLLSSFLYVSFLTIILSHRCIICQKWHRSSIVKTRIQIPCYYFYPSIYSTIW